MCSHLQTWQLPGLTPSGNSAATRFQNRACCCSWSKDGKLLATTGDDGQVKLLTVPEHKVRTAAGRGSKPGNSSSDPWHRQL
jgi:WD40 repeat protein